MNQNNFPAGYLTPVTLTGPKAIRVGKSTYNVPRNTRVKHGTRSGKPFATVMVPPDNAISELHEAGQLLLGETKQQYLRGSMFSE